MQSRYNHADSKLNLSHEARLARSLISLFFLWIDEFATRAPFPHPCLVLVLTGLIAPQAEDVIARRTRLAFLDSNAAREALPAVVDLMGDHLKWGSRRRKQEIKECLAFLDTMNV